MKKILLIPFLVFSCSLVLAQLSSLTIFNENPEGFFLIVDGLRINKEVQTNVQVADLKPGKHYLKIVFEDQNLGSISEVLALPAQSDQVYRLIKNEKFNIDKGSSAISKWDLPEDSKLSYQLQYFSESETIVNVEQESEVNEVTTPIESYPIVNTPASLNVPAVNTTTVTSTTITSVQPTNIVYPNTNSPNLLQTNQPNTPVNINVNLNYDRNPAVPGFPVTTQTQIVQQETTTSTTNYGMNIHGTNTHKPLVVYTPPALIVNGACTNPLTEVGFVTAVNTITSKSFDETKLTIAKQIVQSNCLTSNQIKRIALLFTFEETKLDFTKAAYFYCYDPQNYYIVNDVFTFESSLTELLKHIAP